MFLRNPIEAYLVHVSVDGIDGGLGVGCTEFGLRSSRSSLISLLGVSFVCRAMSDLSDASDAEASGFTDLFASCPAAVPSAPDVVPAGTEGLAGQFGTPLVDVDSLLNSIQITTPLQPRNLAASLDSVWTPEKVVEIVSDSPPRRETSKKADNMVKFLATLGCGKVDSACERLQETVKRPMHDIPSIDHWKLWFDSHYAVPRMALGRQKRPWNVGSAATWAEGMVFDVSDSQLLR